VLNTTSVTAIKERLTEQQEESLKKDKDIESLYSNVLNLQSDIVSKVSIVTSLQERVSKCASDLTEEQTKSSSLQRDYEAAVSQQKKEAEELARLTQGNQQLATENRRLQSELEAALNKRHVEEKKLQGDRAADGRLEEAIKTEEARFSRASKKIKSQEKELSEKTLALEKSLAAEELLKSSLRREKKRFEEMVGKHAGTHSILTQQLREASAYDMQTLRRENADIRAKFLVLEREHDRERCDFRSLSAGQEEMLSRKNDSISDNQFTITNLECIVNELKAKESKIKMRQADLEEALKQEKTRNSELQLTVDQISSSLDKERSRCEKHRDELQEALKKQITTLEENNKLTLSLQKAQETFPRLQEKQRAETNYNFRDIHDTEFRLREQKDSLDESNKALYHLQQEYTNLGRRHCDINAEYRELLRTHTALQVRHERLSYAQGNPRPDFSPNLFQSNCAAH